MKTLMICLLVICSVVIIGNAAEVSGKHLDPGVFNRCLGPNPPPGCQVPDSKEKTRTPAHDYRRGCQKSQHCRQD